MSEQISIVDEYKKKLIAFKSEFDLQVQKNEAQLKGEFTNQDLVNVIHELSTLLEKFNTEVSDLKKEALGKLKEKAYAEEQYELQKQLSRINNSDV